jgi:lipoate-protein ligase A
MGISQIPHEVIDFESHKSNPIPIIRRYSGGGTVVIEPTTILVTLILNHGTFPTLPFPKDVLKWTEELYKPAFKDLPFSLRENDYVIDHLKCGGNAQYFAKNRIVHHTSFVWDYTDTHMKLLRMPPKMPSYRAERSHQDFLYRLNSDFPAPVTFSKNILEAFSHQFSLEEKALDHVTPFLNLSHRKSTTLVSTHELLHVPS